MAFSDKYTVINANSSGLGSLNNAIELANTRPGEDTILFNIPQDGEQIILLDKLLPTITDKVFVDGLSQNAFRGIDSSLHLISLDGQRVRPHGLIFIAGAELSTVLHLKFKGFIAAAVLMDNTFNVGVFSNLFENNDVGIFINNSSFNLIGDGTESGKNIITKSITDGVVVVGNSQSNDLNYNSIYGNTDLGIDLGDDLNDIRDPGDLDDGPNGFQNRPLLDSVYILDDSVTFYLTHIGLNGTIRFDFYSNDTRDTSKFSGEIFLGSKSLEVVDGAKIKETFAFNSTQRSFSVLASENGNTSEFSNLVLKADFVLPNVVNDTFLINEDESSVFNVLLNDVDDNLDSSSMVLIAPYSMNGLAQLLDNRISYTPHKNFNGSDIFAYKVCDLTSREPFCDSAIVQVTVLSKEDPPMVQSDSIGTAQASVVVVDIATNDIDPDGDIKKSSISVLKSVSNAIISVNNEEIGEIKIDYSLIPSFKGKDTITYSICDSTGLCDTGYVFVFVNSGSFPITKTDTLMLLEDEVKTIDVLANDTDEDDNMNRQSLEIVKNGLHGVATYNSDIERISYLPNTNYNGVDTIIYRVCDFTLNCAEDTLYIFISAQNDAPITVRVTEKTIQGNCNNTLFLEVLKDVIEPDENDSLDFSSFQIGESISGISPSKDAKGQLFFDYSTKPDFFGLDSLQYKVCDTQGLCDSSFIVIDVVFNTAPVVGNDKITIRQGTDTLVNVLKNDFDNRIGLDFSSLKITSNLKNGVALKSIGGIIQLVYSNTSFFVGTDKLSYEVCDSNCVCNTGFLEIKVTDTSSVSTSKMVLNDDYFTFKEGCVTGQINILSNDSLKGLADYSTLSLLPFPKRFLWNLSLTGELTADYYPDTIFQQQFDIKYRLCDTLNNCDTATIVVDIIKNAPPKTNTIYFTIPDNNSLSYEIDVLENVTDMDGVDFTTLTIVEPSLFGTSLVTAQHTIKYNYGLNEELPTADTINYRLCDYSCMCKTDKVIIQFQQKEDIVTYDGFSPNGDGINDVWTIDNIEEYEGSTLQIFNRWGSVVYEHLSLSIGENGLWDGEGVPEGVYYFAIKSDNIELEPITGTIILQR